MRTNPAVFKAGTAVLLLGAIVLLVFAAQIKTQPTIGNQEITNTSNIDLPKLGLFGGSVTLYGEPGTKLDSLSLKCQVQTKKGTTLPSTSFSTFTYGSDTIQTQEKPLQSLATVKKYPAGSVLVCPNLQQYTPLYLGQPSTFGPLAKSVKIFMYSTAALMLFIAAIGYGLSRKKTAPTT